MFVWLTNYKQKIGLFAVELNMTPAEIAADVAFCESLNAAIVKVNTQRTLLNSAINERKALFKTDGMQLRTSIARLKKANLYTTAIGSTLDVIGTSSNFNPNEYKPKLQFNTSGEVIQIRFKKLGVQGINIYKRKKGTETWQILSRATKSPFEFRPALENSNQPEQWEFRAFGVIKDKEIEVTSDILGILIGD